MDGGKRHWTIVGITLQKGWLCLTSNQGAITNALSWHCHHDPDLRQARRQLRGLWLCGCSEGCSPAALQLNIERSPPNRKKNMCFFCTNTLQIRIGASLKKCFHHLYFILSSCLEKMSSFLHIWAQDILWRIWWFKNLGDDFGDAFDKFGDKKGHKKVIKFFNKICKSPNSSPFWHQNHHPNLVMKMSPK